jgi:hypothetical protein
MAIWSNVEEPKKVVRSKNVVLVLFVSQDSHMSKAKNKMYSVEESVLSDVNNKGR